MQKIYWVIDANVNRAAEGLRLLEDLARFHYQQKVLSEKLKKLRHDIRKSMMGRWSQCLHERNSQNDIGLSISKELKLDNKSSIYELIAANFKGLQEALRTIEEALKIAGEYQLSKKYEGYRFSSYTLEKEYFGADCIVNKKRKLDTELYCLTAEEYSLGRSNVEVVQKMIKAGVKIIQYREKNKNLFQKYKECLQIRELTKDAGVTLIVNDEVHLAMSIGADGVHIGQEDLPAEKVRELVGDEMIIGVSTHSPEQARDAAAKGADYIGVGPLYQTYTKKDVCDPVGLGYLEFVVNHMDIPFVAIGGIKEHNLCEVQSRGAKCIAMVTEIVGAKDIEQKIKSILSKMRGEVDV